MEDSDSTVLLVESEDYHSKRGCFSRFFNYIYKSDEDDDEEQAEPVAFLDLFRFASAKERLAIGVAIVLSAIVGMSKPAHIYLIGVIMTLLVDVKEPKGDLDFLHHIWLLSSLFGAFFLITFTVAYFANWLHLWASERIAQRVRSAFVASVLARDSFLDGQSSSTGELSNRLASNIDRLKDGIGHNMGMLVRTIAMCVAGTAISFYLDWRTALIVIWSGPICMLTSTRIPQLASSAARTVVRLSEEANGISEEVLLNIRTVVSCNGEGTMIERYSSSLLSAVAPATRCGFIGSLCDAICSASYYVFYSAGIWYAAISYHSGRIEAAGSVFAVVSLAASSSLVFTQLGPHLLAVLKARTAAAKVYQDIDTKPQEDQSSEKLDPSHAEMHIQFNNVSVTYPNREQPALANLSFDLFPGESLALVGKSGCGKSTTLKVLTHFVSADTGSVMLDGQSLENYDKKQWRRMVGVVSQEPALFNGTIRENICLGRPYSDAEVQEACRIADADGFIMALDKGYSTLLGPSGVSLSGGQKQRIAIARAIVSNPRLLLLDEATSALDTKSERIVQKALDAASKDRTTIVVAHRLSTIKNVNRVIVMEEGRVVQSGGYAELRAFAGGKFAEMIAAQGIEQADEGKEEVMENDVEIVSDRKEHVDNDSVEQTDASHFPFTNGGLFSLYFYNKKRAILTTIVSMIMGLEFPLCFASFVLTFYTLKDADYELELFWLMIGNLIIAAASSTMYIVSQTLHAYTGESTMRDVRVACFTSLLKRPMGYFDRQQTSPAASSILLSQQPPIAMAIVHQSMSVVIMFCSAGFMTAIPPFFVYVPLGLIGLAYIAVFLVTFAVIQHYSNKAYNEVVKVDKSLELAVEIFDNASTLQQLGVESHFQQRFDDIQMLRRKPLASKLRWLSISQAINKSSFMLLHGIANSIGIFFVYTGIIDIKQMYLAMIFMDELGWSAEMMSNSFQGIISAIPAARLLFKMIDPAIEDRRIEPERDQMMMGGKVVADSVSFAYPSRPKKRVLNEVDLTVSKGKSMALVGPSGGGKSTMVSLLERFYNPTEGALFLDNIPISSISSTSLRTAIALVSQEPVLFRGSISDNVRLGFESANEEGVREACRMANAQEFIENLPQGYATLVGEKGHDLSGGQKQRIAIARALVRNPRVIILDEATSALDTASEQVVREALLTSSRGRTSITIAHRLDTIRHCDEICFVEDGRIVERGSHDELMDKRGRYEAMVDQQKLH